MRFELWMRSSRQLRLPAQANGIGFVHIVQPNQHYAKKAFTENEKKVALCLPPDHAYRLALGEGYRMLEAQPHAYIISAIPIYDEPSPGISASTTVAT